MTNPQLSSHRPDAPYSSTRRAEPGNPVRSSVSKRCLVLQPPRRDKPELIDQTGHDYARFRESFHDIRIVNRYFGGTAAVLNPLLAMCRGLPSDVPLTVLDIGTGSADIPLALVRALKGRGRTCRITALDNHPDVLRVAREATEDSPEIEVVAGDVMELAYPDGAFDFAMCSLTFHHLGPDGCVRALREMDRVARHGWVVNDGERRWLTIGLIRAFTPLVTRNPLTRHDAVASVWRGFSRAEMRDIARAAGFFDARVFRAPVCRVVVARDKTGKRRG